MKKVFLAVSLLFTLTCCAQDSTYTRKIVNELTSPKFWGRGYIKNGMANAAKFISEEYRKIGLQPLGNDFLQKFSFPVNTFPGRMLVEVNGKKLIPGKDFIINNESIGVNTISTLIQTDSANFKGSGNLRVVLKDKLTWSVATETNDKTIIQIHKKSLSAKPEKVKLDIENVFVPDFEAANVCGIVKGKKHPDSVLMITAHYDHLGGMGKETYFPGANDNAAGVATLLSLAKYYSQNQPDYSIVFVCFAAEEAGLIGSHYFTENPLIPLSHIKFLLNLDLVGTGEAGMTVVNATVYPNAFAQLNEINNSQRYISKINSRGKAANSDHYFFSEKGVPAFFIYTQGGPTAYHDVFDQAAQLPLTVYNNFFKLITGFFQKQMYNN
ncbi:M28 family metallopeptidase [Pedobacter sp. AW1-32]|uniref:M28 family metallopeptidase n=1 Tax=Pedobacter sp. AW1-32 TaxID=3383026 RepID=UPI003FEF5C0D